MKTKYHSSRWLALAWAALGGLLCALPGQARADILATGNFKTGTPTPTLTITAPFTLDITTSGSAPYFDFINWVTNDGTPNQASASPAGQTLSYQINGGSTLTATVTFLYDDDEPFGAVRVNDGLLQFSPAVAVTAGQTLTFLPGTLTFASGGTNFNQPPADFAGSVFLANAGAVPLSSNGSVFSVPEPSTKALALLALGSAGVLAWRKRRNAECGMRNAESQNVPLA